MGAAVFLFHMLIHFVFYNHKAELWTTTQTELQFRFYCLICCSIVLAFPSPCPPLLSFLLPSWLAVLSYRPHFVVRDPMWGDDWSHSSFIKRSPSWSFPGFSSAVRQMPGDLCTSPLSLATNVIDTTLGASDLWLGTRTGAGGTATLT